MVRFEEAKAWPTISFTAVFNSKCLTLRIQICPKKGISLIILWWGWDWDHQTYSREGYGSFGWGNFAPKTKMIHLKMDPHHLQGSCPKRCTFSNAQFCGCWSHLGGLSHWWTGAYPKIRGCIRDTPAAFQSPKTHQYNQLENVLWNEHVDADCDCFWDVSIELCQMFP